MVPPPWGFREIVPAELVDELPHFGRVMRRIRLQPLVVRGEVLLPEQPDLARLVREELLVGEPVQGGEPPRAGADQEHVIRRLQHQLRHLARVLHPFQRGDGAGASGGAVHHARVELHHAVLVGDAAISHRHVGGIVLDEVDAGNRGIERIGPRGHLLHRQLDGLEAVDGRDRHRARRLLRARCPRERGCGGCRSQEPAPGEAHCFSSEATSRPVMPSR